MALRSFQITKMFRRALSVQSNSIQSALVQRVSELVPKYRQEFKELKTQFGDVHIPNGETTVSQVVGGMRGMTGLLWDTSLLDPMEGIRLRGMSIPEVQKTLPKAQNGGNEPLPEALLWLLLTGEVPTDEQTRNVTAEFHERARLPEYVRRALDAFPSNMHAMSQLVAAVATMQTDSKFAAAYQQGVSKNDYWMYALDDVLNLIARLPEVAAIIYRNKYHNGELLPMYNRQLDYGANFAQMLGFDNPDFSELMRLYLVLHSDHEGGNVSAHATRLVGSALSDPYLSFAGGMTGLAGPLHGLANQEVLRWLQEFSRENNLEKGWTKEQLEAACWKTLNSGRVIPGYGHAVLRRTDPRYICQREFALKHLPDDKWFRLVSDLYSIVPGVLTKHGKTQNPWPNVDAHSGVLLQHYGLIQADYYTVLFGVGRSLGVLSQLVIDRILGLPIERPKSVTSTWIRTNLAKKKSTTT